MIAGMRTDWILVIDLDSSSSAVDEQGVEFLGICVLDRCTIVDLRHVEHSRVSNLKRKVSRVSGLITMLLVVRNLLLSRLECQQRDTTPLHAWK